MIGSETLLDILRENYEGASVTLPPQSGLRDHHVEAVLPGLFSHFHQPSVADFALLDTSRINVNFCKGPF